MNKSMPLGEAVQKLTLLRANYEQFIIDRERERIAVNIMDRVTDLKSCGKTDNCYELGTLIEQYIPEWLGEEE